MLTAAQRDVIVAIMDAGVDLTIATLREDGWPQATTVSYVNDGLAIYFGTGSASQKARNIARDNRVSLTIDLPYADWSAIRGLSLAGRAKRVADPAEIQKAGALMMRKFPQVAQFEAFGSGLDMAFYRVDPTVVSVLDYAKGFGHTDLFAI